MTKKNEPETIKFMDLQTEMSRVMKSSIKDIFEMVNKLQYESMRVPKSAVEAMSGTSRVYHNFIKGEQQKQKESWRKFQDTIRIPESAINQWEKPMKSIAEAAINQWEKQQEAWSKRYFESIEVAVNRWEKQQDAWSKRYFESIEAAINQWEKPMKSIAEMTSGTFKNIAELQNEKSAEESPKMTK